MIAVWTRKIAVKRTGKEYVVVFSDLINRDWKTKEDLKVMDDCTIRTYPSRGLPYEVDEHRSAAESFRDELGYEGYMYGGMMQYPSGHRKFSMRMKDVH